MQKVQPGRGLTPHFQLHRQARLEGAPHPPIYSPLGKNFLFFLVGSQVPLHFSPGEALASDTLPRRNYFREVELFPSSTIKAPSPDFLLPHTQYSPKQSENGLADRRCEGRNWQLCPKEVPTRWRWGMGSAPGWLWLAGTLSQRWRSFRPREPRALYSLKPALAPPTGRLQQGPAMRGVAGSGEGIHPRTSGPGPMHNSLGVNCLPP